MNATMVMMIIRLVINLKRNSGKGGIKIRWTANERGRLRIRNELVHLNEMQTEEKIVNVNYSVAI